MPAMASRRIEHQHGSEISSSVGPYDLKDLPRLRARVRKHVDEAIRNMMPMEKKRAYLEAVSRVPYLVETESDPLQFVRYHGYDVWAGAERLCRYWTERKALFGDRAFRPLTITGNGALTDEDVLTLQAGYPAFLPDTPSGRKALLVDRRKWIPGATTENRLRCLFYVFCLLAQDEGAQIEGVIFLIALVTPRLNEIQWPYIHHALTLVASAFPVKLDFHLINVPDQKKQHLVRDMMQAAGQVLLQYFQKQVKLHAEREPKLLFEEIRALGMSREGIPQFLGGSWKFEDFFRWCQKQARLEHQMYDNTQEPQSATVASGGTLRSQTRKRGRPAGGASGGSKTERAAKRRMADLLHSRRKRERKRAEMDTLKEESVRLKEEHQQLKQEQRRLVSLLAQAQGLTAHLA